MQQLALIIPSSIQTITTPEPSVTLEEQEEIHKLTSQLEVLQGGNPHLSFTADDYLKQADAFFLEGRYEDAIDRYNRVIERQPDSSLAWFSRGWALRKLGHYKEAVLSYDQGIKFKSDDHLAWFGRGNALKKLSRYNQAISSYDRTLLIKPDFDIAWYYRSRCCALQGNTNLALNDLERAIKLNPQYQELAKTEPDFDSIRALEQFQRLIDGLS